MEFHIRFSGAVPAAGAIEDIVRSVDPAAMVDTDEATGTLRIATSIGAVELAALVTRGGLAVAPSQLLRLPSVCCGGCSA